MTQHRIFGAFTKVEKRPDGTLYIEGVASSEARDSQGEIVKAAAMRKAIPSYLREDGTGPLREMHQLVAAGKTTAMWVDDTTGKTHVACLVVDSEAVKKVEHGVYQGFSIGGGVVKRDPQDRSIIDELALSELSLVDRGANPEAVFTLVKIDAPAAEPAPTPVPEVQTSADVAAKADAPLLAEVRPLKKGLWTIGCAAELLAGLAALQADTAWEAAVEGDGSPLPAKLKALAADFAALLQEMVGEEAAEIVAGMKAAKAADVVKAAPTEAETLRKVLDEALAKLPASVAPAPDVAALQKRAVDAEAATALAGEALKKVGDERDQLAAALAKANVALATKGSLRAVPIGKGEDVGGSKQADAAAKADDPVSLTKEIHRSGGTRLGAR